MTDRSFVHSTFLQCFFCIRLNQIIKMIWLTRKKNPIEWVLFWIVSSQKCNLFQKIENFLVTILFLFWRHSQEFNYAISYCELISFSLIVSMLKNMLIDTRVRSHTIKRAWNTSKNVQYSLSESWTCVLKCTHCRIALLCLLNISRWTEEATHFAISLSHIEMDAFNTISM